MSHAAPYKHFANREELVLALAERWMGEFVRSQSGAVGTGSPRSDLPALGTAYVGYAHPARFLTIFDPSVNRPGQPPSTAFAELVQKHTDLLDRAVSAAA